METQFMFLSVKLKENTFKKANLLEVQNKTNKESMFWMKMSKCQVQWTSLNADFKDIKRLKQRQSQQNRNQANKTRPQSRSCFLFAQNKNIEKKFIKTLE